MTLRSSALVCYRTIVKVPSSGSRPAYTRLTGEDLSFWWLDSPMQPTTMAMLMVLDRSPDDARLREAFARTVEAVPRLAERVADAPLDITLPHWERDPTFDLDYHVRRHTLSGTRDMDELFREVGPAYQIPFDRSRPLWEVRVYDGLGPSERAALFFKLHHAVADGVGGNTIFAALTDGERDPPPAARVKHAARANGRKGAWTPPSSLGGRVVEALRDRVELDVQRARSVAGAVGDAILHPQRLGRAIEAMRSIVESLSFDSHSPLKQATGRARRLTGIQLPFEQVRETKRALGGSMIDVILTVMARAIGKWHAKHRIAGVRELMTLVPVNLRTPEQWADAAGLGNVATGILVPLPIRARTILPLYREIRGRMEAKKADPAATATPVIADLLSVLPRQFVTWMAEATFGSVDFIVTNVPGIMVPRYLAGAGIVHAYPFAPVAIKSPVSVALYGYCEKLYVGLDSDEATMPDVEVFQQMIVEAFEELRAAALRSASSRPC